MNIAIHYFLNETMFSSLLMRKLPYHVKQEHWLSLHDLRTGKYACGWCTIYITPYILTLLPFGLVGWLCWGLTSQSTIFQSCRDGAIASWVINQYFRGVCLSGNTYYKCSPLHIWAASWQNQQNDCAPSEDSDQPGHSLGAHAILLILSWGGSFGIYLCI